MTRRLFRAVAALLMLAAMNARVVSAQSDARQLTPWLDVPAGWSRTVQDGVVAVSPNDLASGAQLLLLVEPAKTSHESLAAAYDQALRDLGPWRPVGNPTEQRFAGGWAFRLGVGVATLEGKNYTAQTAVARNGDLRVRFWVLADSDATFNRYKDAIGTAIASAQDITAPPAAAVPVPAPAQARGAPVARTTPAAGPGRLPAGFGNGVSGVYVGVERGLSARAGVASGRSTG